MCACGKVAYMCHPVAFCKVSSNYNPGCKDLVIVRALLIHRRLVSVSYDIARILES